MRRLHTIGIKHGGKYFSLVNCNCSHPKSVTPDGNVLDSCMVIKQSLYGL